MDTSVRELGDIALFLLTVFDQRVESSKYVKDHAKKIEQLMTKKQDPFCLLQETVMSQPVPRNDSFAQMYRSLKEKRGDMVFILRGDKIDCHQVVMQ